MSTTQTPAPAAGPEITRAGTRPGTPHKLFVNIVVADLQRSIRFFEALGFTFNRQFTDHTATCMLVGEDAYFMLLTAQKFAELSSKPLCDVRRETSAMFALSAESREAVDTMVKQAIALGGTPAHEPQDHGFMYDWGFYDLDGHGWGVFWMDPSVVQG